VKTLGRLTIVAIVAIIVLIRLFTETLAVLPRWANAVDLALVPLLIAGVFGHRVLTTGRVRMRNYEVFLVTFVLAWLFSSLLNHDDVLPAASLLFLVGHLLPILFGLVVLNLDSGRRFVRQATWLLLGLAVVVIMIGLTQLEQVLFVNPDLMPLTFGTNGNQATFFLSLVISLLLARWYVGMATRIDKALVFVLLPFFFLTGFKSMWVLYPLVVIGTLLLAGMRKAAHLWRATLVAAGFTLAAAAVVMYVPLPELNYFAQNFDPLRLGKVQYAMRIPEILGRRPWGLAVGVGPGTMTSRAFRTYADLPFRGRWSDVTYDFVSSSYMTPLAKEYVLPHLQMNQGQLGSSTIYRPFSSYLSLIVEVGPVGGGAILALYALTWLRLMRAAQGSGTRQTRALALGAAMTLATLLAISVLDNWLEHTRLGALTWLVISMAWVSERADAGLPEANRAQLTLTGH
jgi:hypothetical protein